MKPTTIRLPETTLDELDQEYREYGYRDRTEYIRHILEHRNVVLEHTENTNQRSPLTTDDYNELADRVNELEQRVSELEDQQEPTTVEYNERGIDSPQSDVVEWVRDNQPVSRQDIVRAFSDEIDRRGIKSDSWWRRHGRPELEEAGAEFTRNVGWEL